MDSDNGRNLANEYAQKFGILSQAVNESNSEFKARVAQTLWDNGQHASAMEVSMNRTLTGDYGQAAKEVESTYLQVGRSIDTMSIRGRRAARLFQLICLLSMCILWYITIQLDRIEVYIISVALTLLLVGTIFLIHKAFGNFKA